MVTTVTSPAQNVPAVPPTPVAASAETPHTPFKDVYRDVPAGEKPRSDARSTQGKAGGDDEKEKAAASVAVPTSGAVLPKAALLATPSLGMATQMITTESWAGDALMEVASGGDANPSTPIPHEAAPTMSADAGPSAPRLNTLAISFHLLAPHQAEIHPQAVQQPLQTTAQAAKQAPREVRLPPPLTNGAAIAHELNPGDAVKGIAAPEMLMPSHAFSPGTTGELRQAALAYEPSESFHIAPSVAVHDVAIAPESQKMTTASEIVVHISGNDQSTAAVRVIDRSGTVNVAVHASDPGLRTSLRSNLGELATQLNGQGFKTDIVKPAVLAAHADNAQDSRHDGERSNSQHQQAPQGERQSHRHRRAGSDRWLDELEQETSGDAGTEGGTN